MKEKIFKSNKPYHQENVYGFVKTKEPLDTNVLKYGVKSDEYHY